MIVTLTPSFDGTLWRTTSTGDSSFHSLCNAVGIGADTSSVEYSMSIQETTILLPNYWKDYYKDILIFDTSILSSHAVVTAVELILTGEYKVDQLGIAPDINIYNATPSSFTSLTSADYQHVGTTPFCDHPIAYADWDASGPNSFTLNAAGLAAINTTGFTAIGIRNANYDVANVAPAWWAANLGYVSTLAFGSRNGLSPQLKITYGGVSSYTFVEKTLEINSIIGQTVSTMKGTIHDPTRSLTITEDTDIAEYDISNGELIFAGIISYIDDYSTGIERYFDLTCQDYSILLDRSIVYVAYPAAFTYTIGMTTYTGDLAILLDVFANRVLQPLGSAIGQWGPSEITVDPALCQIGTAGLSSKNFFYWTLREVLDYLTSLVNFDYYVDYQKKLHYYFTPSNTAPYGLSNAPDGTTTLPFHSMRRHRDGTRVVNNFMVIGTQVSGNDQAVIYNNDGVAQGFAINPKGENVLTLNPPSSSTNGLIRVFTNTGSDVSPVWTELTNGGIVGFDEPGPIPLTHDWLFDPSVNNIYFKIAPPNLTMSWEVEYAIGFNGGTPDSVPGSITKYGRTFSTRLVANDTDTAASIMGNLQREKSQFGYALQIIYCSIDSTDFPSTTRFEKGQYLHFHDALLTIDGYYWIHAINSKVAGGTVVSYDLELRNYSVE